MRLIDADKLTQKMIVLFNLYGEETPTDYVLIEIENAPTIDRPHGEWIPCKSTRTGQVTNIDYKCSNCSHHKDRPVPYCEICGSDNRKGGEAE